VTSYENDFQLQMWSAFNGLAPGTAGFGAFAQTTPSPAAGPADPTLDVTVTGNAVNAGGAAVEWELDCGYDGTFQADQGPIGTPAGTQSFTFPGACSYAASGVGAIRASLSGTSDQDVSTFNVTVQVPSTPAVVRHRVINCDTLEEIGDISSDGGILDVSLADIGSPSCIGIGVLTNDDTGSVGHDYTPADGELVSSPYHGETTAPFVYMGDSGWHLQDEVPACKCTNPGRGDLTLPGDHVLESTPCSAESPSWSAGDKAQQCQAAGGTAGPTFRSTVRVRSSGFPPPAQIIR
jgi:hypothetical protein